MDCIFFYFLEEHFYPFPDQVVLQKNSLVFMLKEDIQYLFSCMSAYGQDCGLKVGRWCSRSKVQCAESMVGKGKTCHWALLKTLANEKEN